MEQKVYTLNKEGEKLSGIKTTPEQKMPQYPGVILVHGFGADKHESGMFDELADYLAKAGIVNFRFDFSGRGESQGNYKKTTITKQKNDLACILQYVRKQKDIFKNRIGIQAQSFGTSVAIALHPDIKTLVLTGSIANFFSLSTEIMEKFNPFGTSYRVNSQNEKIQIEPQFWLHLLKYNLKRKIKKFNCPILFIHGAKDKDVPISQMRALYNSANQPKEKIVIAEADHKLKPKRKKMYKLSVNWFKKHL
jgi:uncharacterized protein